MSSLLLTLGCATRPAIRNPEIAAPPGANFLPVDGEIARIDAELAVRRIAPEAFVITHEPAFDSNVLVVRMTDGTLVLCSSPFDFYPGQAHSRDNVVIHFQTRGSMFGGCMIKTGDEIGNVADADLVSWPSVVLNLSYFHARIVVPGHGPVGGPELFQNTLRVVRAANHPREEQR